MVCPACRDADRGVVVIYIGCLFARGLLLEGGGTAQLWILEQWFDLD